MYYEEQLKERTRKEDEDAWLKGQYVAMAIGSCFSKRAKYPDKPYSVKHEEESKITDAERFWEFAQAFNAQFKAKQALENKQESEVSDDASRN